DNADWLTVSPLSGSLVSGSPAANVTVSVDISALVAGTYTATIVFTGGAGVESRSLPVSLTVTAPPEIAYSPSSLTFASQQGSSPANQSLTISNSGGGTLAWTATKTASWLTLSATSGTAPSTITISASQAGMAAGTYQTTVSIAATGASNTPLSVAVTFTVGTP